MPAYCVVLADSSETPVKFCGGDDIDTKTFANPGDSVNVFAQYDMSNTETCAQPGGSVEFTIPEGGADLVWGENCITQIGTSE